VWANNLIVNGSFDATGTTTGSFSKTGTTAVLPGWNAPVRSDNNQINCIVPGNAGGAPSLICAGSAPDVQPKFTLWSAPGPSPNGSNYYLADAWSTFQSPLQQTVAGLIVGRSYTLTFYQASGQEDCLFDDGTNCDPTQPPLNTETQQWQVTFGTETHSSTLITTPIHTSTPWTQQALVFTATATSQLISFLAVGSPDNGPPLIMLDGIDLELDSPEPGPVGLVAGGLALVALGSYLRKRARNRTLVS
jgi:hypothetical protein